MGDSCKVGKKVMIAGGMHTMGVIDSLYEEISISLSALIQKWPVTLCAKPFLESMLTLHGVPLRV